jgi:hypothetical protein
MNILITEKEFQEYRKLQQEKKKLILKNQLTKSNLEAQKYFDLLMNELHKEKAGHVEKSDK